MCQTSIIPELCPGSHTKKKERKVSLKRKSKRGNQKVNHNSQELGRSQQGQWGQPCPAVIPPAASSPAPAWKISKAQLPGSHASSRSSRDNSANNRQTSSRANLRSQEISPFPKSLCKYFKCHRAFSSLTRNKLPNFNLDWAINKRVRLCNTRD